MTKADLESDVRGMHVTRSEFFWVYWSLLAAGLVGYVWNVRPSLSPNDNARWNTIWSLVEYGSYEIYPATKEKFHGEREQLGTIDKVVRRHDGKTVSSKPPLLPTVMAGVVKASQWVIGEPFSKDRPVEGKPTVLGSIHIYSKIVLIVFNVAPFLLMLWLYRRFLDRLAVSDFAWTYSLLAMGLGTLVTGYLVTLNNHVVAATWGFIATYHVLRIRHDGQNQWWRYFLVGLLSTWTAANELPAGLFVVIVLGALLVRDWRKTLLFATPPAFLVTAAFFYTNYLAIGDPENPWQWSNFKPAYLQKDMYQTDVDGETSYWKKENPNRSAIDALNDHPEPRWLYVLHSTIGHHGLFSLTPILVLAGFGWLRSLAGKDAKLRGVGWVLGLLSLVVFSFYMFFTTEHNYGGFCHGLRWMVWLTPLWLLFLPGGLDSLPDRRWIKPLCWTLLAVSILSVFDAVYNPWTRSWLHRILLYLGVIDY